MSDKIVYMYVCMKVCMYVEMYVCMYVCMWYQPVICGGAFAGAAMTGSIRDGASRTSGRQDGWQARCHVLQGSEALVCELEYWSGILGHIRDDQCEAVYGCVSVFVAVVQSYVDQVLYHLRHVVRCVHLV